MIINVRVHANSSTEKIQKNEKNYEVWVKEKPIKGKVNTHLLKILKKYFGKEVKIKSGLTSRNKIIEISDY